MQRHFLTYATSLLLLILVGCAAHSSPETPGAASTAAPITVAEVKAAEQAWCDGLIRIGQVYKDKGDYKAVASQFIDDTYDFKEGKVFFRPTLAVPPQAFRTTREGTLSYFIGGNPGFSHDKGFALEPWVRARYDNEIEGSTMIQIHGDIALAMGNVFLEGADGSKLVVDKTFAFRKGPDGKLRMVVHMSALSNTPEK